MPMLSRVIAQAVRPWLSTAELRVQSLAIPCDIRGRQSDIGAVPSPRRVIFGFSLPSIHRAADSSVTAQ